MADQCIYMVLAVIMRPVQQLLRVQVRPVVVIAVDCAFDPFRKAPVRVQVAPPVFEGLVHRQISRKRKVFQECSFQITSGSQVVGGRIVFIVLHLISRVVVRDTRRNGPERGSLLPCNGQHDFLSCFFIVHNIAFIVTLVVVS